MNFTLDMDFSLISFILTSFTWVIIGFVIRKIYVNQVEEERPKILKLIIIFWVGLFSFSFNFHVWDELVKVSILPLGVWIAYAVLNNRNRWENYRKYAWAGFFSNFLFLGVSVITILLSSLLYPEDQLKTYLSDVSAAELIVSHPTGEAATLDQDKLERSISNFDLVSSNVMEWYETSGDWNTNEQTEQEENERFPYLLVKTKGKQNEHYLIHIETDGKGILVTTKEQQFYFHSDEADFLMKGEAES
ncbi:hypothetical protein [Jeotgalibacillus aurantiacus]|uniref:hypothetical protein n=1 Tax=Jeotgalibacillus aurantiacus TaxID=2763266 RepID=UPI001D0BA191|nr:hypothetical protein [Jeotgalibacillus aurantiacus]